jgi:hypothetical protein
MAHDRENIKRENKEKVNALTVSYTVAG